MTFNKEVFGNIFKRKKDIEKQLQHVQKMIKRVDLFISIWKRLIFRKCTRKFSNRRNSFGTKSPERSG